MYFLRKDWRRATATTAPLWPLMLISLLWLHCAQSIPIYHFRVSEEQSVNLSVGKIQPPPKPSDNVSIVFSDKYFTSLVGFDFVTGHVYTKTKIDREKLQKNLIYFTVINTTANLNNLIAEVAIFVADINDNPPTFRKPQSIFVSEAAKVGDRFLLEPPTDKDWGFNGFISNISIIPDATTKSFSLDYKPNDGLLYLVLAKTLDRESTASIAFTLVATDDGVPTPKIGHGNVTVIVTDINDNDPKFMNNTMNIIISENTIIPTLITTLNVTDADDGENSRLTYQLSGNGNETFHVSGNGFVYLKQSLDYGTMKKYSLIVTATDHGSKPRSSKATLIIHVRDVNNYRPSIHVGHGDDVLSVRENSSPGDFVSLITVSDGDTMSANGQLLLTLKNHNRVFTLEKFQTKGQTTSSLSTVGLFSYRQLLLQTTTNALSSVRYILRVSKRLDREKQSSYQLILNASDDTYNSMHMIKCTVTDINDNAPIFNKPSYNVTLSMLLPIGSYLGVVIATDADNVGTEKLQFQLENTTFSNLFHVTPDTGILSTTAIMTLPLPEVVTLNVSANDSVHVTYSLISVQVVDKEAACFPVIEAYPRKITITKDTATYVTLATYKTSNCKTTSLSCDSNLFTITDTGDLYLNKKPTSITTFILKVIAWNNLSPHQNTSEVTIISIKESDQSYFEKGIYNIILTNHVNFDFPVGRINIPNAKSNSVKYHLKHSVPGISFRPGTGSLYVKRILSQTTCLIFTVIATSSSNSSYETNTQVRISNHDFNSIIKGVSFQRRFYIFQVYENSPIDTVIGCVSLDNPSNHTKQFYIETGNVGGILSGN